MLWKCKLLTKMLNYYVISSFGHFDYVVFHKITFSSQRDPIKTSTDRIIGNLFRRQNTHLKFLLWRKFLNKCQFFQNSLNVTLLAPQKIQIPNWFLAQFLCCLNTYDI